MIRLTREQTAEAERHPSGLAVEGEGSTKSFVLVEADLLERIRRAFDHKESLTRAIAQMEAGEGRSLDESAAYTRSRIKRSADETA